MGVVSEVKQANLAFNEVLKPTTVTTAADIPSIIVSRRWISLNKFVQSVKMPFISPSTKSISCARSSVKPSL